MRRTDINKVFFLVVFWLIAAVFIAVYESAIEASASDDLIQSNLPGVLLIVILVTVIPGAAMAFFEVFFLSRKLRKRPFGAALLAKTLFYLGCILIFTSLANILIYSLELGRPFHHPEVLTAYFNRVTSPRFVMGTLYWGLAVLFGLFVLQVSEKFGQGVLVNFLLGKYHRPKEATRIFMFLDLKSSTTIAERLGHIKYSELIQDCFFDLTDAVVQCRASIYQYVGDEVILTWSLPSGLDNANCLRILHEYDGIIRGRAEHYEGEYGVIPEFKAGVNLGRVTVAEVGEMKKELAFHGDVLNTAARIQAKCNEFGSRLLVSEAMMQHLEATPSFRFTWIGKLGLRGKAEPVKRIFGRFSRDSRILTQKRGLKVCVGGWHIPARQFLLNVSSSTRSTL